MPRSKGQDGQSVQMVEHLEGAIAALVRWEYVEPIVRLRVEQAGHRSGLHDLLDPVLKELDEMSRSVESAKMQVSHVLTQTGGSDDNAST